MVLAVEDELFANEVGDVDDEMRVWEIKGSAAPLLASSIVGTVVVVAGERRRVTGNRPNMYSTPRWVIVSGDCD